MAIQRLNQANAPRTTTPAEATKPTPKAVDTACKKDDPQTAIELSRGVFQGMSFKTPADLRKSMSDGAKVLKSLDAWQQKQAAADPRFGAYGAEIEAPAQKVVDKLSGWQSVERMALAQEDAVRFLASPAGKNLSNEAILAIASAYQRSADALATQ